MIPLLLLTLLFVVLRDQEANATAARRKLGLEARWDQPPWNARKRWMR